MAVQANANTQIVYKPETTFGVAASATAGQLLRRVSTSLATNKDTFTSAEVRSDMQIADVRHGARSVRGNVEGELSTQSYDDWLEALMRGTWAAGVSTSPTDFATGVTVAGSGTGSTLTFSGAGNLLTKGFKVGDIVRATGLTATANNNVNLRITALTSTVMTVYPALTVQVQQATGWTVSVPGKKLTMGTIQRSFTLEQQLSDIAVYEQYTGVRIGGAQFAAQPNGISTVSWELMGQNGTAGSGPYFASPTAQTNTGVVSGVDGALRLNGKEQAVVTGAQLNFTNNLSMGPVIGSTVSPNIFYGRMVCTGSVSAYLEDVSLISAFLNESEIDLVLQLEASGTDPQDFLAFNMQRIKLNGATKTIGADGGVIAQFPFQALLKSGGTGTAYDQSTLTIQRSNS
ncbi:hypothetical protein UFOVP32_12 [uncultured Caudovirales phage]|uniref:Major tail protein n=1 Tax=uncultured Caudovirales phage TaxID=2100421 RepID=A0A6J5KRA9_9CAUD|nr:hypothetical protein UFOVP32_12 [uncultured Caudovirales phage]CAB4123796.1 hypothetical protein UFOVP50_64 [uncultured Caudovirales phage]